MGTKFSAAVLGLLLLTSGLNANTVQLFSFETGDEGWQSATATLVIDGALGVTDGSQSARLDSLTSGWKNNVLWSGDLTSGAAFDAMVNVGTALAGGATDVTLEFDLAVDYMAVSSSGWAQLGMFMNSTSGGLGGWKEYGTGSFLGGNVGANFPVAEGQAATDGVTVTSSGAGQFHVSVPLGPTLTVSPGTFYQIGFKSNGGWGGTYDLAIDNVSVSSEAFAIPEPNSMVIALMVITSGVFAAGRRRFN